jgi:hypothetical protein
MSEQQKEEKLKGLLTKCVEALRSDGIVNEPAMKVITSWMTYSIIEQREKDRKQQILIDTKKLCIERLEKDGYNKQQAEELYDTLLQYAYNLYDKTM